MGIFRKNASSQPPAAAGEASGRICPFCAEDIREAAVVCKHCGRDLPQADATAPAAKTKFPRVPLKESSLSRRTFLMRSLALVTGAIAAALAAIGLGAITAPALRKEADQWSPIGRPGEPGPGEPDLATLNTPLLTSFTKLSSDAYMAAKPEQIPVYVTNHGNGKFTIFDVRCTHLGCPISWDDKASIFNCPCHGGVFSEAGKVMGGPPPRPLNQYQYKLQNGVLYAGQLYEVS
jgi:menaquinol-cytochrome c reductase iron-sulfur subunit